jgi:hypothetical protein
MARKDVVHKKKTDNQDIAKSIQEKAQKNLLPNIQNKAMEVAEFIANEFEGETKGLTAAQVFNVIANRSISDIASITNKAFTPQELGIALNIYIQMMSEINKYIKMPPSKNTFCLLLGISTSTYNNYLQDPEKVEIMNIIETYITGIKLTSAELGELKEISTMFDLKSQHGFVEAQAPITIQHERKLDIDDIRSQLREIKSGRVIEAEYEEKD